ncbi:4-alpha-glucanotransferase [Segatella albensis]|uniref:4-alpha-glucanotransferase n=1 Tax=Segatella albensis TaxID=77768 RepID=UPI0003F74862|nr:4-alpha-glucanotransferase [Segatella albensis]
MKFQFNIDYKTVFGEELTLHVDIDGTVHLCRMSTLDGQRWCYDLIVTETPKYITYYYSVEHNGYSSRQEWLTVKHKIGITNSKTETYTIYNRWNDLPEDSYLYSSAFTDCVNQEKLSELPETSYAKAIRLIVRAPQLREGDRLAIVGESRALGEWNVLKAKDMCRHAHNEWVVDLNIDDIVNHHLEFKFVALDENSGITPLWETGFNRVIDLPEMRNGNMLVYELSQAFFELWNRKLAGTLVPVFSLRSKTSFGVGDFGDLKKMIDFVSKTHQRVLQVLPINDTTITHTWTDSYPYSCISIFALHPQYADFSALPELKDEKKRKYYETLREELNQLPQIDYERVNNAKIDYLKELFAQEKDEVKKSAAFKAFFKETEQWLVPYAQYCYLRDKYGTADFTQWDAHQVWNEAERKNLSSPTSQAYKDVEFWYFVQYILNSQMLSVHEYAKEKRVILKGDIPIGVNRYGCDVWTEPRYFNLNGQAGAPPDDFSVNGQNWGFPTYNWDEMIKDGCAWWVRRFQNMSKFFDAYRIDHVLGFFRIWEIPVDAVHGLLGQFVPSLGMTADEIRSYGFNFQEKRFTEPFITDWVLDRMFGERADEVRKKYLDRLDDERYKMKPEFDTQRKVEKAFAGVSDQRELNLRDGLYALISDVLFVRDHRNPELYHPRISVQFDYIYESLYDNDKAAFNNLYNDYFYRRNNQFWYDEAMKKLPKLVQATRMLVCAEDLGMVPDCVPWVMNELKILSLELQSMPKDPKVRFGHLSRNPYRSVCTISSHDMPTLRQWWDEDMGRTQEYYNTMLYRKGAAPHPLPGWLASDIIARHLASPSMLCVLSIQDWLAIDENLRLPDQNAERINIPANPRHYWRYRMHLNLEDLMENQEFTNIIIKLINESGRR